MRRHSIDPVLGVLAFGGVLYSGLLLFFPPPGWWWAAIAGGAVVGWIVCEVSRLISGHPQAGRWASLCGLLAGGFTWMPMLEPPTMAAAFRVFLPLALRLALKLPAGNSWVTACLLAGAALRVFPVASEVVLMFLILCSLAEFLAGFGRSRWAQYVGISAAVPTGFAAGGGFGLDPFVSGAVAFTVAIFALIIYASTSAARYALPEKTAS